MPKTKDVTHVIMVIDKSGSMYPLASDVIGGFNGYLDDLAKDTKNVYRITTVLFDTAVYILGVDKTLDKATRLNEETYSVGGSTALLDAVGASFEEFDKRVKLGDEDKALMVINTDGQENASTEFTKRHVKDLITLREASGKWSVVYLGAHADAFNEAGAIGIRYGSTVSVTNSSAGYRTGYSSLSKGTVAYAAAAPSASAGDVVAEAVAEGEEELNKK